ncbi:NADH-quinone oxidoreductase subunit NuoK [bacterium]|nr:NADH-quinone oxidoreductase subunit NuoK [bacterium]NBW99252.1 NADH-quinone oxidoreductase subunit NuoK [bacterium]NBX83306.1 NADH-quinone oxidoreductase subunit NuoK [bacterium]
MNVLDFANSIEGYLLVSSVLLILGIFAVLTRKNAIGILLGVELILNAAGINFVAFSKYHSAALEGQLVTLFLILIAAAEAAVALAIILRFYRLKQTIDADEASLLRH